MNDNNKLKFVDDNEAEDFNSVPQNQSNDNLTVQNHNPVNSLLKIEDDEEPSTEAATGSSDAQTSDAEENEEPALVQTQHSFVNSPWSRTLVVVGVFGTGFVLLFLFLNPMFNRQVAKRETPKTSEVPPPPTTDEFAKQDGDVYAKLALARQAEELAALNNTNKPPPAKAEFSPKDKKPTLISHTGEEAIGAGTLMIIEMLGVDKSSVV